MSVEAMAAVLHHSRAKGTAKLVLLGIANHDGDGGAWPSIGTLAKYANVDTRNAQRAVERLRELGEIRVHVQAGGLAGDDDYTRPNRYDVLVACPPWCDRSTQHRDTRKRAAGLWTNRVAKSPGGGETATGRGGEIATQTVTPKPSANQVSALATDRARDLRPTCSICSQPALECERREATSGHTYTPRGKAS